MSSSSLMHRWLSALGALLAGLALAGTAHAAPPPRALLEPAEVTTWLDGFMPNALAMADVAGASVAIVHDGKVIALRGYGFADVASGKPVDPAQTRFPVASISKIMTWTAVMQLVREGRLDLHRDINAYLDFRIEHPGMRAITLADLMTHCAGFQDNFKNTEFLARAQTGSLRDYLVANRPPLIFAPGTVTAYSNYGASLAGYIVQRVSGEPFADYAARHIFAPAAMAQTSFDQSLTRNVATAYPRASESKRPLLYFNTVPAAALRTTAADMARFMNEQLASGLIGVAKLPGLGATTVVAPARAQIPGTNGYWSGYAEMSRRGVRVYGHSGDISGFHSDMYLLPDTRTGLFIAMNSDGRERGAQTVRTQLFRAFLDRYVAAAPAYPAAAAAPGTPGKDIAGTYRFSRRIDTSLLRIASLLSPVTVSAAGPDTITVDVLRQPSGAPKTFRLVGPDRFREVGGDSQIAVQRDARGQIKGWTTDEYPAVFVFQPVTFWSDPGLWMPLLWLSLGIIAAALVVTGARLGLRIWHRLRGREAERPAAPRLSLLSAISGLVMLGFYGAVFWWLGNLGSGELFATSGGDSVLTAIEGLGALAIALTPLVMWRVARAFSAGGQGWAARVALLGIAASYAYLDVFALVHNLVNQDLRF